MPKKTKAQLLAEIDRLLKRIAVLERAKAKRATQSQDVKELRVALLEAEQRQAATSAILQVISRSPTDVQPVFDAIVGSALWLFGGLGVAIAVADRNLIQLAASGGGMFSAESARKRFPMPLTRESVSGQSILECVAVQIADTEAAEAPEYARSNGRALGFRAIAAAPMMRENVATGSLVVMRKEPGPFSDKQIRLLQTFADQAVIAIENVRLFNEIKEALERQTATADILRVISGSPTDTQPVFEVILDRATKLCDAETGILFRYENGAYHAQATRVPNAEFAATFKEPRRPGPGSKTGLGRLMREKRTVHIPDLLQDAASAEGDPMRLQTLRGGVRTWLGVPLLKESELIGAILVYRSEPRAFGEQQISLLETFADQAVIAIENARLFNETKEALEQQTATGEILASISGSMTDTKPVFDAIVRNLLRLFDTRFAVVQLLRDGTVEMPAVDGEPGFERLIERYPRPLDEATVGGQAMVSTQTVQYSPVIDNPAAPAATQQFARDFGFNSVIFAPMIREDKVIGAIGTARREPKMFDEKQVALIKSFADQAVIAIENVRLFNETKEALERQTATAEILKVISSSPTDVQPVFETILENAVRLCDSPRASLYSFDQQQLHLVATKNWPAEALSTVARAPQPPKPGTAAGRAVLSGKVVRVEDALTDPAYDHAFAQAGNWRQILGVPLMREGAAIGVIAVTWPTPGKTPDRFVELLTTFADQAVIAIENVRLFKELQARTEALTRSVGQLTALGEVGQAISSTLDLETVLKTIVSRAVQLTGLDAGGIYEYDERAEEFRLRAAENMDDEIVEILRSNPIRKGEGAVGGTAVTREPIQVPETQDESYQSRLRDLLIRTGRRALLAVPLLREDHIIGALAVQRNAPGPFAPEVVELLQTFATQSAMAIQNARLFREIAEKGEQLEVASRHKSDFLASMSHELRTPLNAILGFNEMILGQVYGEVPADMQEPLADIQTSGKHLLRLINNVLDLAKIEAGRMELALADYSVHDSVESVRATLRPLAADKGLEFVATVPADIPIAYGDSGRITQCLMNLAGNSLKFTKAGKVEISVEHKGGLLCYRVADTGIGIAPDKLDSVFLEFKQSDATIASEYGGTGLGLSISKKFVEMHGGRIWVESELGTGSTFIFEIPLRARDRAAA